MAKPVNSFRKVLTGMQLLGKLGPSLQRRSFVFFLFFLIAVMSGLLLILFSTGVFSVERNKFRIFLQNELGHAAQSVEQEYGVLSVEGVLLAERLSKQIEITLDTFGLNPADLKNNSQYLEPLLGQTVGLLRAALEKNKSSGVFLTLNATVNPSLITAESSRAGLFLKNMEPNVISITFPTIRLLKGPISIARQEDLDLLPQWQMEFSVQPGDFFFTTINGATESDLPLSRLYYWDPGCLMTGCYNKAMLLCAPLIASDGTIIGVCGFEVSAMLFKLQYTPANSPYTRAFAMLAPLVDNTLDTSRALYAGHFAATHSGDDGFLSIKNPVAGIFSYVSPNGTIYSGLHHDINLYPKGSVFSGNQWALAVLIPNRDLAVKFIRQSRPIQILLLALFIFGVGAAALLSRRHVAPVVDALRKVKTGKVTHHKKTNIREIDDLMAFLATQDESDALESDALLVQAEEMAQISPLVQSFIENVKTLSPAERNVFELYLQGYTAKEIADKLCISINTIKTHNKRIYYKLNVSSRKELLLYVKMIQGENHKTADDAD